ncbi:MAG: hypothetical protein NDJ90_02545 [Oligoflexia bacterium]|nr:hypothetical protein [Oligoflexia bacterium]
MKKAILMLGLILAATAFRAEANELNAVVLGYDMEAASEGEVPFVLPCRSFMGALFCDEHLVIDDLRCGETLSFTRHERTRAVSVSCTTMVGETVEIARTRKGAELRMDDTQDGMGFLPLDFNPRVTLVSKKLHPNGAKQDLLVIRR